MAHYDQNQKEVSNRGQGSQRRPLRGLRTTPYENPGPGDRIRRNAQYGPDGRYLVTIVGDGRLISRYSDSAQPQSVPTVSLSSYGTMLTGLRPHFGGRTKYR